MFGDSAVIKRALAWDQLICFVVLNMIDMIVLELRVLADNAISAAGDLRSAFAA